MRPEGPIAKKSCRWLRAETCRMRSGEDEGANPSLWEEWFSAAPWASWGCAYSKGVYSLSMQKAPKRSHTQSWGQTWWELMLVPDLLGILSIPSLVVAAVLRAWVTREEGGRHARGKYGWGQQLYSCLDAPVPCSPLQAVGCWTKWDWGFQLAP